MTPDYYCLGSILALVITLHNTVLLSALKTSRIYDATDVKIWNHDKCKMIWNSNSEWWSEFWNKFISSLKSVFLRFPKCTNSEVLKKSRKRQWVGPSSVANKLIQSTNSFNESESHQSINKGSQNLVASVNWPFILMDCCWRTCYMMQARRLIEKYLKVNV